MSGESSDSEEILSVFPKDLQESWKENPDALMYLSELCSMGLPRLHQEADRLAEEKTSLTEQTQDLAFHNYKTFIHTAECSHEIFQDFNIIETKLDEFLKKLPTFNETCQEFGKQALNITSKWHETSLLLKKHPQLLEFLEMPQLMDTYVQSGLYEEALELAAYIKRLDRKHSNIPLVSSIVTEIQETLNVMLYQLLSQLREDIKLPTCLKVIGYLRRMDVFNELELRIKFLQARGTWFRDIVNKIPKDDPYQHLIKTIEMSRIHLFDIITQYRAIFSDDDPLLLATKDNIHCEMAVFQSWVVLRVSEFLEILREDLRLDVGGKIDSVFAQCMYFGLSFSRVGIDFRPLVVPIFEKASLSKFSASVREASSTFEQTMLSYTVTNYGMTSSMVMSTSLVSEDSLQPPSSLLDFHPLAQYCNAVLIALNDLKLCCSFSILAPVVEVLKGSLNHVVSIIVDYENREKNTMLDSEKDIFSKFCVSFAEELVPHFEKCLDVIFPKEELATYLGVTLLELNRISAKFVLNVSEIIEPMTELLPPKMSEDDEDVGIVLNVKPVEPDETSPSAGNQPDENTSSAGNQPDDTETLPSADNKPDEIVPSAFDKLDSGPHYETPSEADDNGNENNINKDD